MFYCPVRAPRYPHDPGGGLENRRDTNTPGASTSSGSAGLASVVAQNSALSPWYYNLRSKLVNRRCSARSWAAR